MPLELILAGLAVVAVVLVASPAGRRLIATAADIVDASVAMYAVRSTLGLDTTTARQRRIAERNAREQAEILRRIGGAAPLAPSPSVGTRAVVADRATETIAPPTSAPPTAAPPAAAAGGAPAFGTPRPTVGPRRPATGPPRRARPLDGGLLRERHLRDALVATAALAVVIVTVTVVFSQPSGGVLGVTGAPSLPLEASAAAVPDGSGSAPGGGVIRASAAPSAGATRATSDASGAPAAAAGSPAPGGGAGPTVIDDPTSRLAGTAAGGQTARIALGWTVAADSPPPARYLLERRVAGGPYETVARMTGDARTATVSAPVGAATTFRLTPLGATGTSGPAVAWPPVSPAVRQESSAAVALVGGWRTATGPSLSGGGVAYSRAADARATLRWTGTDVGWIATRTPMSGSAQVRLDGVVVATVHLRSPDLRYRQLVFRRQVPAGPHVLEIRSLGGGRVDVDAFIILR